MKIYVASSWRNLMQQGVVHTLRAAGYDVYDFKHPDPANPTDQGFHWSDIDPEWKSWTPEAFAESLKHPYADHGFDRDMAALEACDCCVVVMPCGRSAHLEAGYAIGAGKPTAILLSDGEPELMYKMASAVCTSLDALLVWLAQCKPRPDLRKQINDLHGCLMPVTMTLAEREMIGEPLADDDVVLSFMGSGASAMTTVGMINEAFGRRSE